MTDNFHQPAEHTTLPAETEKKKCTLCERLGGVFGVLLGGILLFISIDVLTGGKLSTLISGGSVQPTGGDDKE